MDIGGRTPRRSSLSQINVTPFVDVMLVLLIIFMVTAPMLEKGVDVQLPEVSQAPDLNTSKQSIVVSIDKRGRISVGKQRVESTDKLVAVIKQMQRNNKGKEVYLEADKVVTYQQVVRVLAAIRRAGVNRLGMVALEQEK